MKEFHLFYAPDILKEKCLPADEANHAVRVLRMKEGDGLRATDGCGHFFDCTITLASPKHCAVQIDRQCAGQRLWRGGIHLAVAPTKNMDRMEWLAEKATEIGLDSFTFVDCSNSERHIVKPDRVERIVVSATKQSHKAWKPVVEPMIPFDRFLLRPFSGQRFIAHCYDMADEGNLNEAPENAGIETPLQPTPFLADVVDPTNEALVLIGPEGDFSIDEVRRAIAAGVIPVSLGESRLRTETAALVAVHILNLAKRLKR